MLKTFARFLAIGALLAALPAAAQAPPAATAAGGAEALAWRAFQSCLAISRGATLDTAAAQAGFIKDEKGWAAEIAERTLTLDVATPPAPPGARACILVVRGPLVGHTAFAKRLDAWAVKDGYTPAVTTTTPAGGQTIRYATPDEARALVLAYYPETGNPDQPTRTVLFVGWKAQ
ncbi:MAG: hypothetical protein Q7U20_10180 [Caulobacter sp.]|nr:hypothetical protein [Caulobacter sp.]